MSDARRPEPAGVRLAIHSAVEAVVVEPVVIALAEAQQQPCFQTLEPVAQSVEQRTFNP